MSEEIFTKVRYCFQGGYTLPQFCVDNGIKKPLFVLEKSSEHFLREIYAQFRYDGRLLESFCFSNGDEEGTKLDFFHTNGLFWTKILVKNISAVKLDTFDKIILLTKENINVNSKQIIRFVDMERYCIQRTYVDIPLLHFLQRYPHVKLILTNFPSIRRYKGGSEFNKQLLSAAQLRRELVCAITSGGEKNIETPLDKFGYTNEQVLELIWSSKVKKNSDGTSSMLDENYPLRRIQNGKRMTAYHPEHFQNRIYVFGSCHCYGVNAPFDKTIESYLQQMLNENNLPYRVENESQHFAGRYEDIFYNLNKINPEPGDIIFFWIANFKSNENSIPFCDISDVFDPPIDYRQIYCRQDHVNELGYKLVAEKYFKFLTQNNFFRNVELNYPLPPPVIIDMVYLHNLNKAA